MGDVDICMSPTRSGLEMTGSTKAGIQFVTAAGAESRAYGRGGNSGAEGEMLSNKASVGPDEPHGDACSEELLDNMSVCGERSHKLFSHWGRD